MDAVDLTIGWDEMDRVLMDATPSDGETSGYDDLMAELDAGGAAPFAADDGADNSAWEPFSADEFGDAPVAAAPVSAPIEVPALADEVVAVAQVANMSPVDPNADLDLGLPEIWGDLEEDLISAIPSPQPSGYTELLRHVDNEELAGLADVYDDEIDTLVNPDSSGDPLDFEALLSVTSRDGTAELRTIEPVEETPIATAMAARAEPVVDDAEFDLPAFVWADDPADSLQASATPDQAEARELDVELGEIEPFSFNDFFAEDVESTPNDVVAADSQYGDLADVFAPEPHVAPVPVDIPVAVPTSMTEEVEAPTPFDWSSVIADEPASVMAAAAIQIVPVEEPEAWASESTRWPTFIGHTSDLIDREPVGLFDRMRSRKRDLQADGTVVVDRTITVQAPAASISDDQFDEIVRPGARPRLATVDGFAVNHEPVEVHALNLNPNADSTD